jgi:regulatory protein
LSRRALSHELRKKGVSDHDAEAALEAVDGHVERAAAEQLVLRKAKASHGLDRDVRVRRLVGMLARKGYSSGVAFAVVNQVLDAEDDASRV